MDAARFAELCRNATITMLESDLIADYVDDIHEEFSTGPSGRSGAAEERAILDQALAGFAGYPIEVEALKENLPPRLSGMPDLSPLEEARLRVLAAGLDLLPPDKHELPCNNFVRYSYTEELEGLSILLGDTPSIQGLKQNLMDQQAPFVSHEMLEESAT